MSDLSALIEKLEKAEGGSRVLNGMIWKVVDPQAAAIADTDVRAMGNRDWTKEEADRNAANKLARLAPPFTTSLDAALTLVPADHTVYLTRPNQKSPVANHRLCYACVAPAGMGGPQYAKKRAHLSSHHPDLQIALCIAALRARAA
jgi:hypothetical protein